MALKDWGLTPSRIAALTPAELADYEQAIAEYDAAVRDSRIPWAYMSGLPAPPSAAGIRAILNFASVTLAVPEHVTVANVNMAMELEALAFALTWDRA